ncbi:MAG: hypothetical protein IPK26_06970 [Planctomycetes bacterium]|nr:hypothetical protein [Planctomycetota bacterium]
MRDYASRTLRLEHYVTHPGDGRKRPQIPAQDLIWAQLAGQILQTTSFHGVERLVRSGTVRGLALSRSFSEDALAYFNERLDPQVTRDALVATARLAKCNKVFAGGSRIGLAVDGTSAGHTGSSTSVCDLCRPQRDDKDVVIGHRHEVAAISVVGVGVSLPLDVEPYGPGDSELVAGQRLLRRCVSSLGARFADYVAADAKFACAPFLNLVQEVGLHAIVRLKKNLPDLFGRAQVRFNSRPPDQTFEHRGERVEIWDEGGFQPWEGLNWRQVRVIRYLQYRAGKTTIEAYWLTDYPMDEVSSQALFKMAKSRWEIENEGFNEAKTRHGMEHICHHDANSVVVGWLLMALGIVIERLYRNRYLHRGTHPVRSAADLVVILRLALGRRLHDTS